MGRVRSLWSWHQLSTVKVLNTGSLHSSVNFLPTHFSLTQSVRLPSFCLSISLPDSYNCDHKDGCFWVSDKNRCMVPDRIYSLSTNTEYVPFSTRGWFDSISLQQSDKKENKKICQSDG